MRPLANRFIGIENLIRREFVRRSLVALRVSGGAVFFGCGVLKFSPASALPSLAMETTDQLTFGLVAGSLRALLNRTRTPRGPGGPTDRAGAEKQRSA